MIAAGKIRATGEMGDSRPYRVRARNQDVHHARLLHEPASHAAAIAFVEHLAFADDEHAGISVVVQDVETGHEHSFWVHLDGGEIAADP